MAALGQKRTFTSKNVMSALPLNADISSAIWNVRFGPEADMQRSKKSLFDHLVGAGE
jgi:hypothetical protein